MRCHQRVTCSGRDAQHPPLRRLPADELVVELIDPAVKSEERSAEALCLAVGEAPGRLAAHGLSLEQLPEDLDEHEYELREAALEGARRETSLRGAFAARLGRDRGAVAQLGERLAGSQKVRGSSPLGSIDSA